MARAIKIPAAPGPMEVVEIDLTFPNINKVFGDGAMIERVWAAGLHHLGTGAEKVVMVVDEEGRLKGLPLNSRAAHLYGWHIHGEPIVGDAYLIGEGVTTVKDPEFGEYEDVDFKALPESQTVETVEELILFSATAKNAWELSTGKRED